jgi:hypothetical protein
MKSRSDNYFRQSTPRRPVSGSFGTSNGVAVTVIA